MLRKLSVKILLALFFGAFLISGCGKSSGEKTGSLRTVSDLNAPQYKIGGMTGTIALKDARRKLPLAQFPEYSMPIDAFTALCAGKIDAVVLDRPTLCFMALAHPELAVMNEDLSVAPIAVVSAKKSASLMKEVNAFIRKYRADGTCRQMIRRWFHTKDPAMPEIPAGRKTDGLLKIGITANNEPLCFIRNGILAGFDTEFSLRFGAWTGKKIEFKDIPYDALIPALLSGKIDLAVAFMDADPEREESVLFSENYIDSPITILTYKKYLAQIPQENSASADRREDGFFSSLAESFYKTFLRESRWQLILQGLATTIVITFFAVFLGTLLAFPVCMMCRSGNKLLSWFAGRYVSLLMGTPILVILMIFYYVVFAKVDISGIIVAILAFALDFSAYTSVMLRSGIEGIPRGQTEAALALGYSPMGAFFRFVLPQAARTILPVYRGAIINTLKSTSVVGYIAIMDLTKTGDIIRSRTYDAFFPLISIALIYFLTAKLLTLAFEYLEKYLDPENRRDRLLQRGEK